MVVIQVTGGEGEQFDNYPLIELATHRERLLWSE